MFGMMEQPEPTDSDVGVFISESSLEDWHLKMQAKMPDIFTADDKIFGKDAGQHPQGTKLMAFFDDDPKKPMRCEVMGSRWKLESPYMKLADNREPHYIVLINGELSQIVLTSAHEQSGWKVGWD